MLYLLDANVLIDANRDYYAIDRVPEFWDWLEYQGNNGHIKIPIEIYDEIKSGTDELSVWVKEPPIKEAILLEDDADPMLVDHAVQQGYAPDLTDDEILKIGRDPFLLGYALRDPDNICIVTTEVSKPSKSRANKRIPDVANELGINSFDTFQMLRKLDFRTNWR